MLDTYLSFAVLSCSAAASGQLVFRGCGRREWTPLAPAVGLAALCGVGWGAASLIGPGAALAVLIVPIAGAVLVRVLERRAPRLTPDQVLIGLIALVLASIPFVVELRFGILGTSLNPDMSQHLFATDRIASGGTERLIAEGYPLGPHALVAGLGELGVSFVHGFGGLALAIAVAAALAPLALLDHLPAWRRGVVALLVAFAYMTASYLIQGAFKETMQALFVLAFAVGLHELARGSLAGAGAAPRWGVLGAVPLAVLAAGSIYAYSFPGLAWIAGALAVWALAEVLAARRVEPLRRGALRAVVGMAFLLAVIAPELGRVADFASFETFDPDGPGLGNLFNPISPLEALGIWPSGDFRLDPGAGFAPAAAFWLGGLIGLAALVYGLAWWLRRGELAVPAALVAAIVLYLYPLLAGTPYQEAKAIAIAAPLAMLISTRALAAASPPAREVRDAPPRALAVPALAVGFALLAGGCSILALVNGPVGPDRWSPELIELRESGVLGPGGESGKDTLLVAPRDLLLDERGQNLFVWELRGGNVCTGVRPAKGRPKPLAGIENVVVYGRDGVEERWQINPPKPGPHCPFIGDGARADPAVGA